MRLSSDMLGYFATHQRKLDDIVEGLARAGFPDCNTDSVQNEVAAELGYQDAEEMYEDLDDDDVAYINEELRRKLL